MKFRPISVDGLAIFANGEFVPASSMASTFASFNPCNGKVAAILPHGTKEDVNKIVEVAHSASYSWKSTSGLYRSEYLMKLANLVRSNHERLAHIESYDCGKPLRESRDDIRNVAICLELSAQYAAELDKLQNTVVDNGSIHFRTLLRYEPFGVVGLITPWNYPLLMAMQKVAPALAAGNVCVLKPSEYASMTCIEFAELTRQANLPRGVFNLITGLGTTTGHEIVINPLVRKISFTGSVATGRTIMRNAAEFPKPVHLELGGKSPMIVFDDVDITAAVDWIMTGIFWCSGQICSATSRVLIHSKIYDKVCDKLASVTRTIKIGVVGEDEDPDNPVFMGPIVSHQQYDKVLGFIQLAKEEKLTALIGGMCTRPIGLENGYFVMPTIYKDVPTSSTLWKEEIFGPVLCVRSFDCEEEAIREANNSNYGLAAAVFTSCTDRLKRVSERLDAGVVWENCSQPVFQQQPFGGFKMSGFGRECGREGFSEFYQIKTIVSCAPGFNDKSYT